MYKGLEARERMVYLGNQIKVFVLGFLAGVCNGTQSFVSRVSLQGFTECLV